GKRRAAPHVPDHADRAGHSGLRSGAARAPAEAGSARARVGHGWERPVKPSAAVRCYRLLVRLLPAEVRRSWGDEATDVFAQQWADARPASRWRVAARAFVGLLQAVAVEWSRAVRAPSGGRRGGPRRGGAMIGLGSSTRQAVRSVGRSPGFALAVVALLGLGVGSVSAIWAIVDHVLLRPLPYPAIERLIEVQNGSHSGPSFEDFRRMGSVELWVAVTARGARLPRVGEPLRVDAASGQPAL